MKGIARIATADYSYIEYELTFSDEHEVQRHKAMIDLWKTVNEKLEKEVVISGVRWRKKDGKNQYLDKNGNWQEGT